MPRGEKSGNPKVNETTSKKPATATRPPRPTKAVGTKVDKGDRKKS